MTGGQTLALPIFNIAFLDFLLKFYLSLRLVANTISLKKKKKKRKKTKNYVVFFSVKKEKKNKGRGVRVKK